MDIFEDFKKYQRLLILIVYLLYLLEPFKIGLLAPCLLPSKLLSIPQSELSFQNANFISSVSVMYTSIHQSTRAHMHTHTCTTV